MPPTKGLVVSKEYKVLNKRHTNITGKPISLDHHHKGERTDLSLFLPPPFSHGWQPAFASASLDQGLRLFWNNYGRTQQLKEPALQFDGYRNIRTEKTSQTGSYPNKEK